MSEKKDVPLAPTRSTNEMELSTMSAPDPHLLEAARYVTRRFTENDAASFVPHVCRIPADATGFYRFTRRDHIQRAAIRAVQFEEGAKRATRMARENKLPRAEPHQTIMRVESSPLLVPTKPIGPPGTMLRDLRPSAGIAISESDHRVRSFMQLFGDDPHMYCPNINTSFGPRPASAINSPPALALAGKADESIPNLNLSMSSRTPLAGPKPAPSLSGEALDKPGSFQLSGFQAPVVDAESEIEHPHNQCEELDPTIVGTNPRNGLPAAVVEERRAKYGFNEILEKKTSAWRRFIGFFMGPIAYLIEASFILSAAIGDWPSFGIILALLFINAFIGFIEESKAESAIDALKSTVALKSNCVRDGEWREVLARELVPGDIVLLRLGDSVPADAQLLGLNSSFEPTKIPLSIDESGLTGETLPVEKRKGDMAHSATIVKQGAMVAVVAKIGEQTQMGRSAKLMAETNEQGHFQKVVGQIGNFLIVLTVTAVGFILIVKGAKGYSSNDFLTQVLSLTIAAIPVGLPTVMSITMATGASMMAKKQVIARKITAVEPLAGVEILCSDKTGTLTLNQLTLDEPYLEPGFSPEDLLLYAFMASEPGAQDAIEVCVRKAALQRVQVLAGMAANTHDAPGYRTIEFHPFDPISKLTRAIVHPVNSPQGEVLTVAKGAPQVILKLCNNRRSEPEDAIRAMAQRGLRALGVARGKVVDQTVQWELVGLLSLLDPPRPDSATVIRACKQYGIDVKMITGDAPLVAKEVAKRLGLFQNILTPVILHSFGESEKAAIQCALKADGFAQVIPEDKFRIVELLQKDNFGKLIAMTGDGVNDAPALKKADVGFAVHGCTDAARNAASIVLLEPGLSPIVHGIFVARQIFQRMRSYTVYRISATIFFVVFLFVVSMAYDYTLPPLNMVLVTLMNDIATIAIATDNAIVSERPDKWRLGEVICLSFLLGGLLAGEAFGFFFVSFYVFNASTSDLNSIMYLVLSMSAEFIIFSTRLSLPLYRQLPSLLLTAAVIGAQVIAFFLAVYGALGNPIGWGWGMAILGITLSYTVLIDVCKVFVYRHWNYELTAKLWPSPTRRNEARRRRERAVQLQRIAAIQRKLRIAVWQLAAPVVFRPPPAEPPQAEPLMFFNDDEDSPHPQPAPSKLSPHPSQLPSQQPAPQDARQSQPPSQSGRGSSGGTVSWNEVRIPME